MQQYDLIIVGGGLVGAGLAVALRQANLRMALIDARAPSTNDPRLFALNNSCYQFLANLGVWQSLAPHASPIQQIHVSHQGHFGAVRLNREDVASDALGYVIPAHYIETALNEQLLTLANVTLYRPATLTALHQSEQAATLHIDTQDGEQVLTAPLVIGADGTDSTVRKQLNMATRIHDYQQGAIVTRTILQRPHRQVAYERFVSNGAIAMLPLTDSDEAYECATIWSLDSAKLTELMSRSDDDFLRVLQREFGYRLGRLLGVRQRHVYPLRMVRVEKAVQQCVYLLGNSAHTLHPIAAQGFNLAVYEVAVLVDAIMEKQARHESFTAADLLRCYERTQKQQERSIGVSHCLSQLFTSESVFKSIVVQLGMIGLDMTMPIKRKFIEGMMGRAGRVPHLLMSANKL